MHLIGITLERSLLAVSDCRPFKDHSLRISTTPKFDDVSRRLRSFAHVVLLDCCRVSRSRARDDCCDVSTFCKVLRKSENRQKR